MAKINNFSDAQTKVYPKAHKKPLNSADQLEFVPIKSNLNTQNKAILTEIVRLNLSFTDHHRALTAHLSTFLPNLVACEVASILQANGFGPYPELYRVPNSEYKVVVEYPSTTFLAESNGNDGTHTKLTIIACRLKKLTKILKNA